MLLEELPLKDKSCAQHFTDLVASLPSYQQRAVLSSTLHVLNTQYILPQHRAISIINGCAALVRDLISENHVLVEHLVELCVNIQTSTLVLSLELRRLALVVLCDDEGESLLNLDLARLMMCRSNVIYVGEDASQVRRPVIHPTRTHSATRRLVMVECDLRIRLTK